MPTCRSRSMAARCCARSRAADRVLTGTAGMSRFARVLGERFGSFKTLAPLGEGSMGEVYLAEHQRIARRAAIKVLSPERTRDADAVRRLFVEARATSMIRHPGIVEI